MERGAGRLLSVPFSPGASALLEGAWSFILLEGAWSFILLSVVEVLGNET